MALMCPFIRKAILDTPVSCGSDLSLDISKEDNNAALVPWRKAPVVGLPPPDFPVRVSLVIQEGVDNSTGTASP
jgi:hypothetical protein